MKDFAHYPSLKGRAVIVSGGASGIGADIVRGFVAQGARVGFLDLDETAGQALANELGGDVHFAKCDLRDIDTLKSAISSLREQIGPITVLVNNAARDDRHDWREVTEEFWNERAATNIRHQFFAIQFDAQTRGRWNRDFTTLNLKWVFCDALTVLPDPMGINGSDFTRPSRRNVRHHR